MGSGFVCGKHGHVARCRDAGICSTKSPSSANLKLETTDRSQLDLCPTGWLIAAARTTNSPTADGAVGLIYNLSNGVVDLDAAAAEAFSL